MLQHILLTSLVLGSIAKGMAQVDSVKIETGAPNVAPQVSVPQAPREISASDGIYDKFILIRWEASEQALALYQCLQKLENRQREVVSLAYVRDLSHGELAQQLNLPLGTVKTRIRRAMEQLRTCMARFA